MWKSKSLIGAVLALAMASVTASAATFVDQKFYPSQGETPIKEAEHWTAFTKAGTVVYLVVETAEQRSRVEASGQWLRPGMTATEGHPRPLVIEGGFVKE